MATKIDELLKNGPLVLNIGLHSFFEASKTQGIPSVHIKWEPPAQGNHELLHLLDKLL
ncbi:MAG: fdrA domain protein [Candidatus Hodarchaeales archaeon]